MIECPSCHHTSENCVSMRTIKNYGISNINEEISDEEEHTSETKYYCTNCDSRLNLRQLRNEQNGETIATRSNYGFRSANSYNPFNRFIPTRRDQHQENQEFQESATIQIRPPRETEENPLIIPAYHFDTSLFLQNHEQCPQCKTWYKFIDEETSITCQKCNTTLTK